MSDKIIRKKLKNLLRFKMSKLALGYKSKEVNLEKNWCNLYVHAIHRCPIDSIETWHVDTREIVAGICWSCRELRILLLLLMIWRSICQLRDSRCRLHSSWSHWIRSISENSVKFSKIGSKGTDWHTLMHGMKVDRLQWAFRPD